MAEASTPAVGVPGRSFAQAAATVEKEQPLRVVQMEGLVALKLSKHCKEWAPQLVTGLLLGLDIGSTLEVTHCFPMPTRVAEEDTDPEAAAAAAAAVADGGTLYQLEMMKCLRDVNVDNNIVGWYQTANMGTYQTLDLIDTFLNYQENIKRCVCLIHDPERAALRGGLAVKAVKLKQPFMELYRANTFTGENLRAKNLTWSDIFEEIPIRLSNSVLVSSVMSDLNTKRPVGQNDLDRLLLSADPLMEQSLGALIDCMEDLSSEQQRFQYHYRSVQRQQQQQSAWLQKRRSENATRKAAGEEPLPETDPTNPIFRPIPEPSRIESYLILNQVAHHSTQLNEFSGPTLNKMYLMGSLTGSIAP